MSLSSPNMQNPSKFFFEWNGGNGTLSFYNKDTGSNVIVPFSPDKPFEFIVLDELNGITGWSDQDNSGIWSNETRSTRDDFTVRTKKRVLYVGPYKNEQGISQVAGFGARYVKVVYFALHMKSGDWTINRLKLTGAALNSWIDFTGAHNVTSGKIKLTGSTEGKKGATVYQIPTFEFGKWTDDEYSTAIELDRELQNYLAQALTAPKYDDNAEPIHEDSFDDRATPEQLADFEAKKAKMEDKREDADIKSQLDELGFGDAQDFNDTIPF